MPSKVFCLIDRNRCKRAAAILWNSLIAFIHDFHCKYLLFLHKLQWHRIPRLSISLRFQCRQKKTIIYMQAGWTTVFWNSLGWFQNTCIVTSYNCLSRHKWTFFIPISTIDLCINIAKNLGWCYLRDRTHTHVHVCRMEYILLDN